MSLRFERRSAPLIRLCGHGVSTSCVHSTCVFFRDYFFLPLPISLSPLRPLAGTSLFFAFCLFTRVPSSREDPTTHGWTIRREIFIQPPTRSNSLRPQVHSVLLFETIIGRMIFTGVNEGHRRFATRHGSSSQPYRYHTDSSWFVYAFIASCCFRSSSRRRLFLNDRCEWRLPEDDQRKRRENELT